MSRRLSAKGNASRERILQAALAVASERGYDGTTISLITTRAGVPASSLYWHFADKDALLAAALEYGYDQWRAASPVATIGLNLDYQDAIRERFKFSADALLQRPAFWHMGVLMSLQRRPSTPLALDRFYAIHAELTRQLHDWYDSVLPADPEPSGVLVDDLVRFHLAAIGGLYVTFAIDESADDVGLLIAHVANAIIELIDRNHRQGDR